MRPEVREPAPSPQPSKTSGAGETGTRYFTFEGENRLEKMDRMIQSDSGVLSMAAPALEEADAMLTTEEGH